MKKLIFIIMLGVCFTQTDEDFVFPQKGMKNISGGFSFQYSDIDERVTYGVNIYPSIGYFLFDDFSADIGLGLSRSNMSYKGDDSSHSSNYFNIGGRYYCPLSFGIGYIGVHLHSSSNESGHFDNSKEAFSLRIGTLKGLNDFVYFNYGIYYNKGIGENKAANLGFSGGLSIFIK